MKSSKPVSNRQMLLVLLVAVILISAIVGLSIFFQHKNSDDDSALNKDVALRTLWEKSAIIGEYDGKNVILTNKDEIFVMLKSGEWKYLPDGTSDFDSELSFFIDEGYNLSICEDGVAVVSYNGEYRYYKTPSGIVDDIITYIKDTTLISTEDASAFLSVSGNVFVTVEGASKTVPSGEQIANALNMRTWTEFFGVKPDFEPAFTVDNGNGLKVSVYKSINIGVIEYNGMQTVYSVDELTVASSELVAKSYFNDATVSFSEKLNGTENFVVVKKGEEFNLSPDTSIDTLLSVSQWERRFKEPAGLPSKADIVISDGASFTVNLYSLLSVAEFDNVFYSVPSTVFSSVEEYLKTDDEKTENVSNVKNTVLNGISEKKQIPVIYKGSKYIVSVKSELSSVLSISLWTDSPVSELSGTPDIIFNINQIPELTLNFYSAKNLVSVISGSEKQIYKIPSSVIDSLTKYIQENLYTEAWTISAIELGALQKTAETADITVTDGSSYREKYSEDASDAVSVLAALDLLPLESRPEILSVEKTEILFKGAERFIMSMYPAEDGSVLVNVTGTFYSRGKYIDRWFSCEAIYTEVVNALRDVNARASDMVAALFCEAIRSGDIETINRLIGTSEFDYSGIKTLMLNDLSVENTDKHGVYIVSMNVEDPVDSPFIKGIRDYTLVIGPSGGILSVVSFIDSEEYEVLNSNDAAVKAIDSFTSWNDVAGLAFNSVNDIENKSSVISYLMLLCKKDGLGKEADDNSSLIQFTQEEINACAKKYFGIESYEATDVSCYNSETGLYSYEGTSAPARYKRAVAVSHAENGTATVTFNWYSDPLRLCVTDTVIYTLNKNEDGSYAIISALTDSEAVPDDTEDPSNDVSNDTEEEPTEEPTDEPVDENAPTEEETDKFIPPSALSPTETMFKYFEYLNEKDVEKANSLLYEAYARSESEYDFDSLTKISVLSCAEIPTDFDWYEPWYKDPFAYVCVVAEVNVDCLDKEYLLYSNGLNSIEIYMIKTSENADWRIISEKHGGEGLLGQRS
ncbi:MAG: hypothetical protein E7477_06960 [Ruminococcaceae bacterium]|nr:hypothetical protein [Oscillospiraceae bacterium]